MNPLKEHDVKLSFPKRLQLAVKMWKQLAETPLKHSYSMYKLWASGFYDSGYGRTHTINLMDRGVSTLTSYMAEGNPSVMVKTLIPNFRPWAFTTQLALKYYVGKIGLAENVLIPVVINSIFSAGVTKTSTVESGIYTEEDEAFRLGIPCTEVIDFANYIGDPAAKRRKDMMFEGDIYSLPTEYAKEFFKGKADFITPDGKLIQEYSPEQIGKPDFDKNLLALRDYTTFVDLYLYDENTIVTIMPSGKKPIILREVEWDGYGDGPYDVLAYKYIGDTPIPLPPAWSWHDIDVTMNILIDKMRVQAENQKDLLAYNKNPVSEKDAELITQTPNNGTVGITDINGIKPISFGGVNPLNFQWVNFIESEFSKQGANADVLGGRGAEAPTLGQEQMIFSNASRIVSNMYNRYHTFMTSIIKKIAYEFWTNPTTYCPVIKEIPGVGEFPEVFADADKVGDFYDLAFEIVPYSTQRQRPEQIYNNIMQFLTQWVLPSLAIAKQQGVELDFVALTKELANYINIDTLASWYKTAVPDNNNLSLVDYKMTPKKNTGQTNDAFGAGQGSKMANLWQQQERAGGKSSPPNMEAVV